MDLMSFWASLENHGFLEKYKISKRDFDFYILNEDPPVGVEWDFILMNFYQEVSIEDFCAQYELNIENLKTCVHNIFEHIRHIGKKRAEERKRIEEEKEYNRLRRANKLTDKQLMKLFGFNYEKFWVISSSIRHPKKQRLILDFRNWCEKARGLGVTSIEQVPAEFIKAVQLIKEEIARREEIRKEQEERRLILENQTEEEKEAIKKEAAFQRRLIREKAQLEKDLWIICKQLAVINLIKNDKIEVLQPYEQGMDDISRYSEEMPLRSDTEKEAI